MTTNELLSDGDDEEVGTRREALKYLAAKETEILEEEEDSLALQVIDILKYLIRNMKRWSSTKPTEHESMHRVVYLMEVLLRDTSLAVRTGEKVCKSSQKTRSDNHAAYGGGSANVPVERVSIYHCIIPNR